MMKGTKKKGKGKKAYYQLKKGKSYTVKLKLKNKKATNIKSITFKSSKKKVFTVDKAGKITALKKGKAKLTVKAGGRKSVMNVRVK
jgi:uncharacterized protein YjdB